MQFQNNNIHNIKMLKNLGRKNGTISREEERKTKTIRKNLGNTFLLCIFWKGRAHSPRQVL
jgi:hypothetical protein